MALRGQQNTKPAEIWKREPWKCQAESTGKKSSTVNNSIKLLRVNVNNGTIRAMESSARQQRDKITHFIQKRRRSRNVTGDAAIACGREGSISSASIFSATVLSALQDIKLTLTKSVCKSSNSFTPFHLLQVHNSIFPESPESPPLAWKISQHSFKCQNATPPLISLPYPMQPRTPLRAGSPLHACKNLINRSLNEREWGGQKRELSGPNRAQQEEDRLASSGKAKNMSRKIQTLESHSALPTSCLLFYKKTSLPALWDSFLELKLQTSDATLCGSQRSPPLLADRFTSGSTRFPLFHP